MTKGLLNRTVYNTRPDHDTCDHSKLEAHVIYDMQASGYRAQLRCKCSKTTIDGRAVRGTHLQAEDDSKAMMRIADANIAARSREATT